MYRVYKREGGVYVPPSVLLPDFDTFLDAYRYAMTIFDNMTRTFDNPWHIRMLKDAEEGLHGTIDGEVEVATNPRDDQSVHILKIDGPQQV